MTRAKTRALHHDDVLGLRLHEALTFWRSGALLAAVATLVLAVRFLHLASHVYESRSVVEFTAPGQGTGGVEQVELLLAEPEAAERDVVFVRALPSQRFALFCRDREPGVAQALCVAASNRLRDAKEMRIAEPATLPALPLPAADGARSAIVLLSLLIGLLGGAAWMALRALLDRRPPARPRSPARRTTAVVSYAPSASALSMGARSEESPPAPAQAADHAHNVVALPAAHDWVMNPELLQPDILRGLSTLRDELCVAAAEGCFVVGVTSTAGCAPLKSRLAARLAWSLTLAEQARVLLLDVDFGQPNVDAVMGLEMPVRSGFSQQIERRLRGGPGAPWVVVRCTPHLSVLAEGRIRTPSAIFSNTLPVALAELRQHFDLIVADGPVLGNSVSMRAFDELTDGIVLATSDDAAPTQLFVRVMHVLSRKRLLAAATMPEPPRRSSLAD